VATILLIICGAIIDHILSVVSLPQGRAKRCQIIDNTRLFLAPSPSGEKLLILIVSVCLLTTAQADRVVANYSPMALLLLRMLPLVRTGI
jgi:hypothetical protein